MKSKYILGLVLVVVFFFQELRIKNIEDLFNLNQVYNFTLPPPISGNLKIEQPKKYLILYEDKSEGSKEVKIGLEEVFQFSKIKYDTFKISTDKILDLKDYSMIILVVENYEGLLYENFLNIKEAIQKGKNLFITQRSYRSPFNSLAGIEKVGEFIETKSFQFKKDVFPGLKKLKPDNLILVSSGLNMTLKNDIDVIATTDKDIPLMWTNNFGNGKIFYNNSTLFQGKIFRGIMKQIISYIEDVSFYPILNSKVLQIDDFPSPIPVVENDIIEKEYGLDTSGFFNLIWWQDMMGIVERQKLKMTGFIIIEYNDLTIKDKIIGIEKRTFNDLSKRGRELKSIGGELGLHGYNHYSLGLEKEINYEDYGYVPWENIAAMKKGLEVSKDEIKKLYGDKFHIYSYVAPSNLLPNSGKKAIVETFTDIKAFCGIFYGEDEPGLLLQEVGRDPQFKDIYSLPRMSSGFFYNDIVIWQILNGIAAYGYLSHFIHPDDIMDKERGEGKSWEELKTEFEKIFDTINKDYSVLEPHIQSKMTYNYSVIEKMNVSYEKKDDIVYVNIGNYSGEFEAHFRAKKKKIIEVIGGEFKLISNTPEDSLYLITAKNPELKIVMEDL
ncbi:DUF2194 domain-containing protein [Candidatus Cetobacterium colombiensis]|uniref:DUF2194 domain-containing protein n=1 Tax=Candidatus Cetobacterium colombiensis TaxID=3073100 RepID=A0ABU4W5Z1_9FUSO|nr:DUF2194 domain-containing protein [Candidatus Cetobacterium colombiensis]MDX8334950.1 DUF2194 domain-containing protein [Candidatus Cetobacterium colombiensis]